MVMKRSFIAGVIAAGRGEIRRERVIQQVGDACRGPQLLEGAHGRLDRDRHGVDQRYTGCSHGNAIVAEAPEICSKINKPHSVAISHRFMAI